MYGLAVFDEFNDTNVLQPGCRRAGSEERLHLIDLTLDLKV
jgi:hypothetical protein